MQVQGRGIREARIPLGRCGRRSFEFSCRVVCLESVALAGEEMAMEWVDAAVDSCPACANSGLQDRQNSFRRGDGRWASACSG